MTQVPQTDTDALKNDFIASLDNLVERVRRYRLRTYSSQLLQELDKIKPGYLSFEKYYGRANDLHARLMVYSLPRRLKHLADWNVPLDINVLPELFIATHYDDITCISTQDRAMVQGITRGDARNMGRAELQS